MTFVMTLDLAENFISSLVNKFGNAIVKEEIVIMLMCITG